MLTKAFILPSALAVVLSASASMAADLPSRSVAPVMPPMAAEFSWTGMRVGAQVGYAGGGDDRFGYFSRTAIRNHRDLGQLAVRGGFIGLRAGYDYQFAGSRFVLGAMVDGDINFMDRSVAGTDGLLSFRGKDKSPWDVSLTGRAGYSFGRTMVYALGGVSWAKIDYTASSTRPLVSSITDRSTYAGWVAGAGLDYAVTDNLIIGAEYRYHHYNLKDLRGGVLGVPGGSVRTNSTPSWHRVALTASYKF